jgi:hypothetical protein
MRMVELSCVGAISKIQSVDFVHTPICGKGWRFLGAIMVLLELLW